MINAIRARVALLPLPRTPSPVPLLLWLLATAGRLVWWPTTVAVRWPARVIAGAVALVALTPVTAGDVTGAVIAVCAVLTQGGETRVRVSTLPELSRIRRRIAMIRRRWTGAMADAGLTKPGANGAKRSPRIRSAKPTPVGVRLTVASGHVGLSTSAFASKAENLKSSFRALDLDVTPGHRAGTTIIDVVYSDPFRHRIDPALLPAPSHPLMAVVGLDRFGQVVEKDMRLPHLVVGMQGAGKSSEVWQILRSLVDAGVPFRLRVFDPKGGQEFADMEEAAYYYERNPTQWGHFLEAAFRALEARQAALRDAGLRKNDFTVENPLDVLVIDELLTVMALSDSKTKISVFGKMVGLDKALMVYLSTARSAGFTVIACSQLSQKTAMGDIRDLFAYVTCLRVMSDDIVRSVLGDPKLYPAHELPRDEASAGIGYMGTERGVVKYRSAYNDERSRARIARDVATMSVRLGKPVS